MALNSVSSEEFSFPDSSHHSGIDSPPLWKHSPRLITGKQDDINDQRKSFSYVETRSRWSDQTEEKMDLLWEDLNEELTTTTRSQSLRIDLGGEKKPSVVSDERSAAVTVECGMKLTKKTVSKKKKISPNVLVMMRVLKKLLVLRSSSHRSPAKTHPR